MVVLFQAFRWKEAWNRTSEMEVSVNVIITTMGEQAGGRDGSTQWSATGILLSDHRLTQDKKPCSLQ